MVAGRVRHWKHGWIPISPEAKAWVAGGRKGPMPGTSAVSALKKRKPPIGYRADSTISALANAAKAKGDDQLAAEIGALKGLNYYQLTQKLKQAKEDNARDKKIQAIEQVIHQFENRWNVDQANYKRSTDAKVKQERDRLKADWLKNHPEEDYSPPGPGEVKTRRTGQFNYTAVGGYPEVIFQEPVDFGRQPDKNYLEAAQDISFALKDLPRAAKDPIWVSFSPELPPTVMADTNQEKPHKIRLNSDMWRPLASFGAMQEMRDSKFGITAVSVDPDLSMEDQMADFRRNVITHEVGHVLHMRDLDELLNVPVSLVGDPRWGAIEQFVQEDVTPRQLGWNKTGKFDQKFFPQSQHPSLAPNSDILDDTVARWQADSLGRRSQYAISDPFEFFAEAFTDGMINGDQASESGKRALQIAKQQFGKGSPSVRDRLYQRYDMANHGM